MGDKLRFRHPRFVEFVDGFCRLRKWGPGELDGTIRVLRRMGGVDIPDTLRWMAGQGGLNDGEVWSNVIIRPWRGPDAMDRDIRRWRRTPRTTGQR